MPMHLVQGDCKHPSVISKKSERSDPDISDMFRYVQIRDLMQSDPSDAQTSDIRFGPSDILVSATAPSTTSLPLNRSPSNFVESCNYVYSTNSDCFGLHRQPTASRKIQALVLDRGLPFSTCIDRSSSPTHTEIEHRILVHIF